MATDGSGLWTAGQDGLGELARASVRSILQPPYDRVRQYLPRTTQTYRGIPVRDARILDTTRRRPDYKAGLLAAIEAHAPGSHVEIVGFGRGISTVYALRSGAEQVTAYEAAPSMLQLGVRTVAENTDELHRLRIHHALVGLAVDVFGDESLAERVSPEELGIGDCLVMDCEGAELAILRGRDAPPASVAIVETHPGKGAPSADVRAAMDGLGYEVEARQYEPGSDKDVLIGRSDRDA